MRILVNILIVLLFCSFSTGLIGQAAKDTLLVEIQNIKKAKGKIWIAVYDHADKFLSEDVVVGEGFEVTEKGNLMCQLVLPLGEYALSVFHDRNNNEKLDTKIFGIPKEPYCFSNNVRKPFRAPRYHEVLMHFNQNNQTIHLKLK